MQSEKEGVKNTSICFFINKKTAQGVFVFYSVLFLTLSKTATATPRPKRQETGNRTKKTNKRKKQIKGKSTKASFLLKKGGLELIHEVLSMLRLGNVLVVLVILAVSWLCLGCVLALPRHSQDTAKTTKTPHRGMVSL